MQYMGGKTRQAKHIVEQLLRHKGGCTQYLEPFMGGGAIFSRMAPHFPDSAVGADAHPDLMMMWQALQDGWEPPAEVSRDEWYRIKDGEPSALRGFVGFGCSFGGRWFEGYASNARGCDFAEVARRGALKKAATMGSATLLRAPYNAFAPSAGTLVYCDPPYASTKPYSGTEPFDSGAFWSTMRKWADAGAVVLVSEYSAPEWAEQVWSRDATVSLKSDSNTAAAVERLYLVPPTPVSDPAPTVEAPDAEESSMSKSEGPVTAGMADTDRGAYEGEKGPWFGAMYDGECAAGDCAIFEGDRIRADGRGGYECETCGEDAAGEEEITVNPRTDWQQQASAAARRHTETTAEEFMDPVPAQAVTPMDVDAADFMDPDTGDTDPALNVSGQPKARYEWRGEQNLGYLVKLPETGDFRRYKNGNPKGLTRATTFNKAASDRTALSAWGKRNVVVGATLRRDILLRAHGVDKEDPDGKRTLDGIVADLEAAAGAKTGADVGTFVHELTEWIDGGVKTPEDAPEEFRAQLRLYVETLERYGLEPVPGLIERTTYIAEFGGVVGSFDRIFYDRPNDRYVIGDVKTAKSMEHARDETFCQMWTYAHGVNTHGVYDWNTDTWQPPRSYGDSLERGPWEVPEVSEVVGVIIHMPVAGDDAGRVTLEVADLVKGAAYAELCHDVRSNKKPKRVLWPEPAPVAEAPRFKRGSWQSLFRSVTSREQANVLYKQAKHEGLSTEVLGDLVVIGTEALARLASEQQDR